MQKSGKVRDNVLQKNHYVSSSIDSGLVRKSPEVRAEKSSCPRYELHPQPQTTTIQRPAFTHGSDKARKQ